MHIVVALCIQFLVFLNQLILALHPIIYKRLEKKSQLQLHFIKARLLIVYYLVIIKTLSLPKQGKERQEFLLYFML